MTQIFIKNLSLSKTTALAFSSDSTVGSLKSMLQATEVKLRFGSAYLSNDEKSLRDYGVTDMSTIEMGTALLGGFQLFVKKLTGETIIIDF
jgi:hypothetical protein